jgi:predicted DNA-binding transcriptional regulator YafY
MDQPKMERLLKLMMLLTANTRYSVEELASRLETSARSVYRYLDTFENAGFVVSRKPFPRIDKESKYFKDITKLIHFSEEETYILEKAMESIDETSVVKRILKSKLAATLSAANHKILANVVVKSKNGINVNALIDAIEERKQVVLKNYSSNRSKTVRDRKVEPYGFSTNYIDLRAVDLDMPDKPSKHFKIERIDSVEILPSSKWQFEKKHEDCFTDVFRMSGFERHSIKLRLGQMSRNLLIEEYPLAEKYLRQSGGKWFFETDIADYRAAGRFVFGLFHDIDVLHDTGFKKYLANLATQANKIFRH